MKNRARFVVFIFIIFSIFLSNCNKDKRYIKINREEVKALLTIRKILLEEIIFDTIFIDQITFSGKGFFDFSNDSVIFFDNVFATASTYSFNGNKGSRHLGIGEGPKEIRGIQNYVHHKGKHIIMNNWNFHTFNMNWERENIKIITFDIKQSHNELLNNPRPDYQGIYEVKYFQNEITFINDSLLIFNIESSHPLFNFCMHNEYYEESRIFAKYNFNSEIVKDIFGYKPLTYSNYKHIPSFDYYHYHFINDLLYINFEPDSIIYIYDLDFNLVKTFGIAGKMKNVKYHETQTYNDFVEIVFDERHNKGYYTDLFALPDKNLVLRCYKTGINKIMDCESNPSRMQIYRNDTLIADVKTPDRFTNIRYHEPFFYADGFIDSEKNIIGFYRFKL